MLNWVLHLEFDEFDRVFTGKNRSKPYDGLLMVSAGLSKVLVFKTRTFYKPSKGFCEK